MVNDFGVLVNPALVAGQAHGGVLQGIGQALLESVRYDEAGQILTGSFMDYALPRAADAPEMAFASHPTPAKTNVLGVKGCGEAGCAGSLPAVMNALLDALVEVRHHPYRHAGDAGGGVGGDRGRRKSGQGRCPSRQGARRSWTPRSPARAFARRAERAAGPFRFGVPSSEGTHVNQGLRRISGALAQGGFSGGWRARYPAISRSSRAAFGAAAGAGGGQGRPTLAPRGAGSAMPTLA